MDHELHPALTATGRFKVKSCLGSGGFGVVFEVYDANANANVALKWLRNSDASTLARFKREFRSLTDLLHPNLVGFRELLTVAGEWFFTMDFVDGVDLLRYVRPASAAADVEASTSIVPESRSVAFRPNPLLPRPSAPRSMRPETERPPPALEGHRPMCAADLRRVRTAFEQLGQGLGALHDAGMLHRDIKPSNVLVDGNGRVVILDLGLVAEMGDDGTALTKTGNIVGTPAYMSPEQAMGAELGPPSDWYSVGVMLFQALTGQVPFDKDPRLILVKKQLEDAPSPSDLVRGIPRGLAELCTDLLHRTPERRPTKQAFLERLAEAFPVDRTSTSDLATAGMTLGDVKISERGGKTISIVPGFVGRETHLWALEEALEETERGNTVLALVHGLSGMGKSTLVRYFLDGVRKTRPDTVILEGRCYERESMPYKALDSLVDALCRYLQRLPAVETAKLLPRDMDALSRVFPVFLELEVGAQRQKRRGKIDAVEERRRAFEALRELLARVTDQNPVILFVDDMQWGDGDSEPFLLGLFRPPDPPPVLFIAAYRSEDAGASPLVRTLRDIAVFGQIEACEIPIGELTPEAASELAATLLEGRGGDRLVAAVARESCGSPLFLRQLAALGEGEERIDLATALQRRAKSLDPDARSLLETLAVAGRPLPLGIAARAAGIEHDIQGVLAKLRAESLVRTRGVEARDEVEIYHDRIREVVSSNLSVDELRAIHRKLGRVISSNGDDADSEALAAHFSAADEKALAAEYAERAADRAGAALAFARAAEMYEMALGLTTTTTSQSKGSLVLKLAEVLANAGRGHEAAARFLQAAKDASATDSLELRRRAAEQLLFSGHIDDGLRTVDEILAAMKIRAPASPLAAVAFLLWRRFVLFLRGFGFRERTVDALTRERLVRIDTCFSIGLGLGMVEPVRGADFQTRYLLLALAAGEPVRIARGLALEAAYRAADGLRAQPAIERLLAKALGLAERIGQPQPIAMTTLMAGVARVLLGQWEHGITLCDHAHEQLREKCTGVAWELDNAAFFAGLGLVGAGRIRELARRLPEQLDDVRNRGDLYGEILLRMQCSWFVNLARGDVALARADLDSVPANWNKDRFLLQDSWRLVNLVELELYEDRPEKAWEAMEATFPKVQRSMFLRAATSRVRTLNARARAALAMVTRTKVDGARRAELREEAERIARRMLNDTWTPARGYALLLLAGCAAASGDRGATKERLEEAIRELEAKNARLYVAAARLRLGVLVGGDEGDALVVRATRDLEAEGITNPDRMANVFAPFSAAS